MRGVFALAWMALSCNTLALDVVYDRGPTVSTAPYFAAITPIGPQTSGARPATKTTFTPNDLLPIRSKGLAPGRVARRTLAWPAPPRRPFFMLGADPHSLTWLRQHRHRLKQLGAVGLLVQVETEEELKRVRAAAGGLALYPTSGTTVARALKLTHYPVLVSGAGIEQ